MFSMAITSTIILFISMLVMLLASMLSKKSLTDREKTSPFECVYL